MVKQIESLKGVDHKMWAAEEFADVKLKDKRLKKRLIQIAGDFAAAPQANIPQASGNWSRSKAGYRFFSNQSADKEAIMESHRQATLKRMEGEKLVLAVQDTTFLNYTGHGETEGLGPIGNNRDKTMGLIAHSSLALSASGLALGLLDVSIKARKAEDFKANKGRRNRLPLEEKESCKWVEAHGVISRLAGQLPGSPRIVSISDRESDFYELFLAAEERKAGGGKVELLVRSLHQRRIEESEDRLWEHVGGQAAGGKLTLEVPRRPGIKARAATLSIRFCKVTLGVPGDRQKYQKHCVPLTLWAIEAKEDKPPQATQALCWRLLTTLEIGSAGEAIEAVRWYALRWQIELFHKILKSGCKAEDRQLETRERLERTLVLDMIVAWRILALCKIGRETPGCPAGVLFEEHQWKALYCSVHKTRTAPPDPPNLGEMIRWLAQLGGFLARKSDGYPGPVVLWRGLQRLTDIADTWLLFNHP